jgi:hypothetical protein
MEEGILWPVDVSRLALDERDVRSGRLKVEEVLRLDLRKTFRFPRLGEVATCERCALSAVVPAAECSNQDRIA